MPVLADKQMWRQAADILQPAEHLKPSEWAERHRQLKPGTTAQAGPWRNDYYPWLPPIMDCIVDEPWRVGQIVQKCGQAGVSESFINVVGWAMCERPCPILFLTSTDQQAQAFSQDRIGYMVDMAAPLKERLLNDKDIRETIHIKRFVQGKLALWGSGSPTKLESEPYCIVLLDEVDLLPKFKGIGDAWDLAEIRTRTFRNSWIAAWSKPTLPRFGVADKFQTLSDQRRWHVPCPHCGFEQVMMWVQVKWEPEQPGTARYECVQCHKAWTEGARGKAMFAGQYRSMLEPAEAKARPFAGFQVSRFYNTYRPLSRLVESWQNKRTDAARQVFWNGDMGEAFQPSTTQVTEANLKDAMTRAPEQPGPKDTLFVTAGVDLQHHMVCFVVVNAWTQGRARHLMWHGKIRGLDRLGAFLREHAVVLQDGRKMPIRLTAMDSGYQATQVYNFVREMGGTLVVPTKFSQTGHDVVQAWEVKTVPGVILRKLDRTYWMDRAMGRMGAGEETAGVVLPTDVTDEYRAHVRANVRVVDVDAWGQPKAKWVLTEGQRDDFLQAEVNSEFAAWLLGLDAMEKAGEHLREKRSADWKAWRERQQKKSASANPWIARRNGGEPWVRRQGE